MRVWLLCLALLAPACLQPGEERALLDRTVGQAAIPGASFAVAGGLAAVRRLEPGVLELWAQAPTLVVDADLAAAGSWRVTVRNAMPAAALSVDAAPPLAATTSVPTVKTWTVHLTPGRHRLEVTPPDAHRAAPWRFALLNDTQDTWAQLRRFLARINSDPAVRFVVSAGDLTDDGERASLERFQRELSGLRVPLFATVGNHELKPGQPLDWHQLFGRHSLHFAFRQTRFSLVDASRATVDPVVYGWLRGWLQAGEHEAHVFVCHIPPLDPVGARGLGFRSRAEAAKLLAALARGRVDLTLYGHDHGYRAFTNAGIEAHISGGGAASVDPAVGHHYLTVDVTPGLGVQRVSVVRLE